MDHYIDRSDLDNARASPLLHTNFNTLPPALIIIAELDALRDEGIGKHGLHFFKKITLLCFYHLSLISFVEQLENVKGAFFGLFCFGLGDIGHLVLVLIPCLFSGY